MAKAAPKSTVTRAVVHTTRAAAPAAAAPKPAPATSAAKPIVDTQVAPAHPAANAATPAGRPVDSSAMELGGGAIVLLALGAGAYALARRRRDDEEYVDDGYEAEPTAETDAQPDSVAETVPHHDPVFEEQPAIVAPEPSAFAWGSSSSGKASEEGDGSDRRPGETWVERAYRGPSPANPSVSLRNRLRRAAFFDKRERDVAEGTAEPVDAGAGLPDGMVEEQERELA